MSGYGDKPFGLRDIKLTDIGSTSQVDLPASQTLEFGERVRSGELTGDDAVKAVVAFAEAVEWSLEAGGISLEAYALMTGRTATESGTTPSQTNTLTGSAGDAFPYFQVYGKSLGEGDDDVHVKLWKCKLTEISGNFAEGEFFVTQASGIAIDDGSNGIWDIVQNETAEDLPDPTS
jgi:hypothetical protein